MLDVGWTELVVIAIVLIIVVGPKDLPPMLRTFGRMMSKMRGMATDFRHQFDEALREADLDDVRKTLSDAQKLNPANSLREAMNPLRQMGNDIKADLQKATRPDEKPAAASPDLSPASPDLPASSDLPAAPAIAASSVLPEQTVLASQPVEPPSVSPSRVTSSPVMPVSAVPLAGAAPVLSDALGDPAPRKRQAKPRLADTGELPVPRKRVAKTTDDAAPVTPRKRKPAALADDAAVAEIGARIAVTKPKRTAAKAAANIQDTPPDTTKSGDDA